MRVDVTVSVVAAHKAVAGDSGAMVTEFFEAVTFV